MRERPDIKTNCKVSAGVIARILPKTIVCKSTEVGESDTIKSPRPKKELKIRPIIASSLSLERWLRNSIVLAASPPEKNAPRAKGSPNMYAPATPGTIE